MNPISYNESLDLILTRMLQKHQDGWVRTEILNDEMKPEIYPNDLANMLESLIAKGYLQLVGGIGYKLTPLGRSFAETGNGFVAKEKRDELLYNNSIKSLELEKKNYNLTILITVITIFGLIATVLMMFKLV